MVRKYKEHEATQSRHNSDRALILYTEETREKYRLVYPVCGSDSNLRPSEC